MYTFGWGFPWSMNAIKTQLDWNMCKQIITFLSFHIFLFFIHMELLLTFIMLIQKFQFLCIYVIPHAPAVYYIEVGSAGTEECVCTCCHMSNIRFSKSRGIHQHQIPTFWCFLEYFNKSIEYKAVVSTLIQNTGLCVYMGCVEYRIPKEKQLLSVQYIYLATFPIFLTQLLCNIFSTSSQSDCLCIRDFFLQSRAIIPLNEPKIAEQLATIVKLQNFRVRGSNTTVEWT